MYPKTMLPKRHPAGIRAAIQDAWSIEIGPDGSGVSFEVSKSIDGLIHPSMNPKAIVNKFAILEYFWIYLKSYDLKSYFI